MIVVKYRYTVVMPDVYKPLETVRQDWTTTKLPSICHAQTMLLVCPIYYSYEQQRKKYVQVLLDVEGKFGTERAFNLSRQLQRKFKFLTMEFTGKTGFHLASKFLVELEEDDVRVIRKKILGPMNVLDNPLIDATSSIRAMPTIRIGRMGNRLAFPVRKKWTYKEFEKRRRTVKELCDIFSEENMKNYILTYIVPDKIVSYDYFLKLVE